MACSKRKAPLTLGSPAVLGHVVAVSAAAKVQVALQTTTDGEARGRVARPLHVLAAARASPPTTVATCEVTPQKPPAREIGTKAGR